MARRIGTTRQEVNRLTNLKHATKIDRIDAALRALGKRLYLDAAWAAVPGEIRGDWQSRGGGGTGGGTILQIAIRVSIAS